MLAVSNITRQFPGADSPVLKNVSFTVNGGERVGLIGPNGSGKSTLLHIIVGDLPADSGGILLTPPDLRIGYLGQGIEPDSRLLVREVIYPHVNALHDAEDEIERLAVQMAESNGSSDKIDAAYSAALEKLERYNATVESGVGERMLAALDLERVGLDTPVAILSGGQKTRLGLAALLTRQPQLLILDEPTNHLDITALEWLEEWLGDFPGGVLVVSHDRTFLDNVVTRIVALDMQTHTARTFEGDYSDYVHTVRSEQDKQWAAWRDQQVEIARMEADVQKTMGWAHSIENGTHDSSQRRYAKKIAKRAKSKEKRLERYRESEERVEKPRSNWGLKLDFDDLPTTGQDVIDLEDVSVGYDPKAPLLVHLNLSLRAGQRVAILGPNGRGKTTLIKTIIGELPPLAGRVRIGASIRVGYLAQEQEILEWDHSALDLLMAEAPSMSQTEARSFLHFFLFSGDDVFRAAGQLSYGERVRLMLALLVVRGANLLILDEPINHLDVPGREKFEQALHAFQGSVLAVVHDRYFIDQFATVIWQLDGTGVLLR